MDISPKLRIPKIQFAKHMKLKKNEDQSVDTLLLLRIGNKKQNWEGVSELKVTLSNIANSVYTQEI